MLKPPDNLPALAAPAAPFPATDLSRSNSLTDLAARFKVEHQACITSLADSIRHAIAAGELLIEAKAQLKHGQWLPWLSGHCEVSERSAQLYMRAAKNRTTIESEIRNAVADLSLNEAMALLALSSDVRKLLEFVRKTESATGPEELIQLCLDHGVGVIHDPNYNPFHGKSEAEVREWHVFVLYLIKCQNYAPEGAAQHVEWILQRPFQNVDEWLGLGPEGDAPRCRCFMEPTRSIPGVIKQWKEFAAQYCDATEADLIAEIRAIQERYDAMPKPKQKRRRSLLKRKAA